MRKILLVSVTLVLLGISSAYSQLSINISSVEVEQNATATVDVTVNNFTDLVTLAYSINYDTTKLEFVNFSNITNSLTGFSVANLTGPGGGAAVKKGQITFLWDDSSLAGKTVAANTRLYSINFKAIGAKGTSSEVFVTSTPRKENYVLKNLTEFNSISNVKGKVTIKSDGGGPVDDCVSPTCTNANSLTFIGGTVSGEKDKTVCVPITVKNFTKIEGGQGRITWNTALLQFTEIKVPTTGGLPNFTVENFNTAVPGRVTVVWSSGVPVTLNENTVIFELCYKIVGSSGQTACIDVRGNPDFPEWTNDKGEKVPLCYTFGKVNITSVPPSGATVFRVGTINGQANETVCVDVAVEKFTKVTGATVKFGWNADQLEFVRTDNYDLEMLTSGNFNNTTNSLTMQWLGSGNAFTKADGHKIFRICFKIKQCVASASVNITATPDVVGEGNVQLVSQGVGGSVTCTTQAGCNATCTLGTITNVSCNGATDGAVALSVTGSTTGHNIVWKNASGTVVKASAPVASGTNLSAVGAGVYTYEVTFNNTMCCTGTATVNQPAVITIPTANVIKNAQCDDKGAIDLKGVTGGNGGFIYAWSPDQGNIANPVNLNPGTYLVTVTDSKGCKATNTFNIVNVPSQIVIPNAGVVTNEGCGLKGSINITSTSGGSGTLKYTWNPVLTNTGNPTNLNEGTYSVTVSDAKNCTATATFTVSKNVSELNVTSTVKNIKCKGGSDGEIQINIAGGCPTITYSWTGGLTGANPKNLKAGTYTVTVGDGAQSKTHTVTVTEPSEVAVALTGTVDASTATAADGKITLAISGGTSPYKAIWSGPITIPDGNSTGTLEASSLKVGAYNVTVTDANGCTAARTGINIAIKSAEVIAPKIGSASVSSLFSGFGVACFGDANGEITAKLSEGTFPITASLKAGANIERNIQVTGVDFKFTGLASGTYTIELSNSKGTITSSPIVITQPTKLAAVEKMDCTEKGKSTGKIEIVMNSTGAGNYAFVWDGINDTDNVAENLAQGFYNVRITDANKCQLRLTNIQVVDCGNPGNCFIASTIMTPNGDRKNDLFEINCMDQYNGDLTIFDRWGKQVYFETNYKNTWQGTNASNSPLPEGSYIWVLNVTLGQGLREVHKGTVTILKN